jgi:hypothetical protein
MIVFELLLNGKVVASAGMQELSVLSQTITAVGVLGAKSQGTKSVPEGFKLEAALTGLTSSKTEIDHRHCGWYQSELKVGDELTIRILERENADVPKWQP